MAQHREDDPNPDALDASEIWLATMRTSNPAEWTYQDLIRALAYNLKNALERIDTLERLAGIIDKK